MSSPRELEEASELPSDKAFEEVNKYIKGVYDILKQEANVGGHLFSTSLSTMIKDPGNLLMFLAVKNT